MIANKKFADKHDCSHNVVSLHQNSTAPEQPIKKEPASPLKNNSGKTDKSRESILVKALCDGIENYAIQKKFKQAEHLREKLLDAAPMALSEIVRTAEIIEREKNAALDPEKMKPFADLFKQFSKSEATAFFSALVHHEIKAYIPVFEQCQFDDRLYFIQSGRFILSYYDSETHQNIDFAILQKGDVAGAETFFSLSIKTTTLMPIENSSISVLNRSTFEKMLSNYPSIESKLQYFCSDRKKSCRIDRFKRQARREYNRYPTEMEGQFRIIDVHGQESKNTISMYVVDLSAGGLCCTMRNIQPGTAAMLYRSWIRITASYHTGTVVRNFKIVGKVLSIKDLPFDEISIHVQFKQPIPDKIVIRMIQELNQANNIPLPSLKNKLK
jgi:CRP-like cAMP-binding protein